MAVTNCLTGDTLRRTLLCGAVILLSAQSATAAFVDYYAPERFSLRNNNSDGTYVALSSMQLLLLGGNNGSGEPGQTDLMIQAPAPGFVSFRFEYLTFDDPGYDGGGYLLNNTFTQLADRNSVSGGTSFAVMTGDLFGFRVYTADNTGFPGELVISNFAAPLPGGSSAVPEPGAGILTLIGAALLAVGRWRHRAGPAVLTSVLLVGGPAATAQQSQRSYSGVNITGRLQLMRTVSAASVAELARRAPSGAQIAPAANWPEFKPPRPLLRADNGLRALGAVTPPSAVPASQLLNLVPVSGAAGFAALNHADQRLANRGNQYSVEPPNPSIAAANGYVVVGVNNAVAVYNTSGAPLLPAVISTNELFGLPPALDRNTGVNGPFPTDMRVFYDHAIDRWFVLQRAQDYDIFGIPLTTSRIYLAVSQTGNPLGNYSIYEVATTNPEIPGCPCFSDFPQIGADRYGFYVSVNEFSSLSNSFVTASILAVSKAALAASAPLPSTYKITLPAALSVTGTGFEFTVHPAVTPPGAAYFTGMNGLQYFVSTNVRSAMENSLGVWALHNTRTLENGPAQLTLVQSVVPTISFVYPNPASQKPGPIPYGTSLGMPIAAIDGGDNRVQSVTYAGSRLYVTVASQVMDSMGRRLTGAAYAILSPVFRSGTLGASVVRQGYLALENNHLLRPAVAVNAQGKGAIAMTLVGPDHFPSAAFVPVNAIPGATLHLAAPGVAPQDGFTGYEGLPARWGDYSTATVAPDGSVWMIAEYVPGPRTQAANWGTYVMRYVP